MQTGLPGLIVAYDWVARRVRVAAGQPGRGPAPSLPVRPRDRRSHADRPSRGAGLGRACAAGRRGLAPLGQRRERAAHLFTTGASQVLRPEGAVAPAGRPYVSFRFDNPHGQSVHGFYATPEGDGPFPVLVRPHGGPTRPHEDRWSPEAQAYVDAGFAVAMINYRGSTGYGAEWRDALTGDIGGPELEDLNAGLAWPGGARHRGPGARRGRRLVVGRLPHADGAGQAPGPLALRHRGHPGRGLRAVATTTCHRTCRRTIARCSAEAPDEAPALMLYCNPINFADDVRVPVLFIIGENDSRCPYRQAMAYVDKLAGARPPARGLPVRHGARLVRHGGGRAPGGDDPGVPGEARPRYRGPDQLVPRRVRGVGGGRC